MPTPFTLTLLVIVAFTLLGLPIGLGMIAGTVVYLWRTGQDMGIAAEQVLQGLYNGYTLLAIPLFIFAANLMNLGSLSDRLLSWCNALVGRFRGGLGHVNVASSLVFSGMSGSAVADAVGVGRLVIEMMTQGGRYTPAYAAALTAASATIGPIIPPSIPLVLYALVSDTSIGYLFLGGVLPGLMMGAVLMAMNAWIARRRNFPVEVPVPLREMPAVTWRALPALLMPVVLLGGIYGGVMTPTEAAAVAALYAFVVSWLLYRSVNLRNTYAAILGSARSMATVGILIAGALAFNYVVTREDIPNALRGVMAGFDLGPIGFLMMVNLILLVLGCLLEGGTILLVVVPIFIPTAQALGIDMVHFGLVVTVNIMIGLITPPYGLLLFVVTSVAKASLRDVIVESVPFLLALIAALLVMTLVPETVLWLPRLMGYKG